MYFLIILHSKFIFALAILGGHSIDIEDTPFQVNYGDICGGALIAKRWVLTTAHCGTSTNYIRISSTRHLEGKKISVTSHVIHPKYQEHHEYDYDVQLLQLRRSLHFHERVKPIDISEGSLEKYIYVAGWGYPKEKGDYLDVLQQVKMEIVSKRICQEVDKSWYNHTLTNRMFCAGGKGADACQGDSGGGAITNNKLIGISSFGYGCGRNIPGVYINVSHPEIREWITDVTGI